MNLQNYLLQVPHTNYSLHSRIHLLHSLSFDSAKCYVKRDDELGFGVSGSKIRKYSTLIPFLISKKIEEVVLIGSSHSNHVLSFSQLLIENKIRPTLFLRGDSSRPLDGNALFTSLFVPTSSIQWISKSNWKYVESLAKAYTEKQHHPTFVLPEGGFSQEALPGALSLSCDLLNNEQENHLSFDHVFIEAGTGMMASSLILGLHALRHRAHVHVLLLAEDKKAFLSRLKQCHDMFVRLTQSSLSIPDNFSLHLPLMAKGFGVIHPLLFSTIQEIAHHEGFLTDPIYSAKLFLEIKRLIPQEKLTGNILIIHSGGAFTLMGFREQLNSLIKSSSQLYTGHKKERENVFFN